VQSNRSGSTSAIVTDITQPADNSLEPIWQKPAQLTSSGGTVVHDSSVLRPLILPPASSVETEKSTIVSSTDYVRALQCSASKSPSSDSPFGEMLHGSSKESVTPDVTVFPIHLNEDFVCFS